MFTVGEALTITDAAEDIVKEVDDEETSGVEFTLTDVSVHVRFAPTNIPRPS